MVSLNVALSLEVQGWDSCVMAKLLFSSQGWQPQVFSVKDQVGMAGLCIAGGCGGGKRETTDGKWFSMKWLDLSLILNVTWGGPCSFALMWHCFSCSNANWRSIWGLGIPGAKAAPWPLPHVVLFNNPSSLPCPLVLKLFLSSSLLIIFLAYISNLLVANGAEFVIDSWVTCFMDYFRSNPIKVNVSTVGKSLWITKQGIYSSSEGQLIASRIW